MIILILFISPNYVIIIKEVAFLFGEGRDSGFEKALEGFNIEHVRDEEFVSAEFEKAPGYHGNVIFLYILPVNLASTCIIVLVNELEKKLLQLIQVVDVD